MNLDDPAGYGRVDPADALGDVEGSAEQWAHARSLAGERADLSGVDAVVVTGMGGSGICGDVVATLAGDVLDLPVVAHKGYGLPAFAGPRTLVVAVSYSGDTEESLSAWRAASARGARLFAVTSGGTLQRLAADAGATVVLVPGGRQPRHSLGYLTVPVLVALGLHDGLDEAVESQRELVVRWGRGVPLADNPLKRAGRRIAEEGLGMVLGGQGLSAVAAYRLKCQLNENAKLAVPAAELPEANHNEVVAWQEPSPLTKAGGLLLLRDPAGEHPRVRERFRLTAELAGSAFGWVDELTADGRSEVARLAHLLLQADLISVYAALTLDRDPTPIPSIDWLKSRLGPGPA